jgi:hypothetical protein
MTSTARSMRASRTSAVAIAVAAGGTARAGTRPNLATTAAAGSTVETPRGSSAGGPLVSCLALNGAAGAAGARTRTSSAALAWAGRPVALRAP